MILRTAVFGLQFFLLEKCLIPVIFCHLSIKIDVIGFPIFVDVNVVKIKFVIGNGHAAFVFQSVCFLNDKQVSTVLFVFDLVTDVTVKITSINVIWITGGFDFFFD